MLGQNDAGSISTSMPIFCLKTKLPTVKRHLFLMVVYKAQKSVVEIDLFFLDINFIQLSDNWKIIFDNPGFHTA